MKKTIDIKPENRQAARAVAQWVLGDRSWASVFIALLTDDDPKEAARLYFRDWPEEFDAVWEENALGGSDE